MKIVKTAGNKKTIRMSRKEWANIGEKAGWMKKAQDISNSLTDQQNVKTIWFMGSYQDTINELQVDSIVRFDEPLGFENIFGIGQYQKVSPRIQKIFNAPKWEVINSDSNGITLADPDTYEEEVVLFWKDIKRIHNAIDKDNKYLDEELRREQMDDRKTTEESIAKYDGEFKVL
jgi:hypothetical protein